MTDSRPHRTPLRVITLPRKQPMMNTLRRRMNFRAVRAAWSSTPVIPANAGIQGRRSRGNCDSTEQSMPDAKRLGLGLSRSLWFHQPLTTGARASRTRMRQSLRRVPAGDEYAGRWLASKQSPPEIGRQGISGQNRLSDRARSGTPFGEPRAKRRTDVGRGVEHLHSRALERGALRGVGPAISHDDGAGVAHLLAGG